MIESKDQNSRGYKLPPYPVHRELEKNTIQANSTPYSSARDQCINLHLVPTQRLLAGQGKEQTLTPRNSY